MILDDVSMLAEKGQLIGLIGPNGSGKTTLLRAVCRLLKPEAGTVHLNGRQLQSISQRETAQRIAVVRQENELAFDFTVWEMVSMGRTPHKYWYERDSHDDAHIVETALSKVGMSSFADRSFHTLSGGEKQRVLIARALAQEAQVLILDEPTNHLDVRYQLEIMELVKSLRITTLAALHDLNLAAAYCDRLYLLCGGRIAGVGTPKEVLSPEIIQAVYGVKVAVTNNPLNGKPYFIFASRHRQVDDNIRAE